MNMKEKVELIKEFLKNHITSDMDTETIKSYNDMIEQADAILDEHNDLEKELVSAKDTIVKLVKTQGNSNPPSDPTPQEKQPRGLEEIAESISNGGK